jgi:hypothetical protein
MSFTIFIRRFVAPLFILLLAIPAGRCSDVSSTTPATTSPAATHAKTAPPAAMKVSEATTRKKASAVRRMTAGTVEFWLHALGLCIMFLIVNSNISNDLTSSMIASSMIVGAGSLFIFLLLGLPLLFSAKNNTTLVGYLFGIEIVNRNGKAPLAKKTAWLHLLLTPSLGMLSILWLCVFVTIIANPIIANLGIWIAISCLLFYICYFAVDCIYYLFSDTPLGRITLRERLLGTLVVMREKPCLPATASPAKEEEVVPAMASLASPAEVA